MSTVTFCCPRCPLGAAPPGIVLELPCTGRVSPALLLEAVASGAGGVLVMGRDQGTCPHGEGDDRARVTVRQVRSVLALVGLEQYPLEFVTPGAGGDAPRAVLEEFERRVQTRPSPGPRLPAQARSELPPGRLDRALALAWSMTEGQAFGGAPNGHRGCTPAALTPGKSQAAATVELQATHLGILDLLTSPWTAPVSVGVGLEHALALCRALGVEPKVLRSLAKPGAPATGLPARADSTSAPVRLLVGGWAACAQAPQGLPSEALPFERWIVERIDRLPLPPVPEIVAAGRGDTLAVELLTALADRVPLQVHWLEPAGASGRNDGAVPTRFQMGPVTRTHLEAELLRAADAGAQRVVLADARRLAQLQILLRRGAWQRTLLPVSSALQLLLPGEANL